ncbi:MAG: hypothetical protein EAZ99_11990 [Alphaproteobacteria bacterium]|nr:hypothetical protein [Alphaproteobacteria bacterium]TAD88864.1 MAG: hypothetical protein EAZ99_11990 [Alphaproteobacteria bacterium]
MTLATIRLELARNPGFPDGSADHGYELHAPLTADGHLDLDAYPALRKRCTVRRFWAGHEEHGVLHRTANHAWAFSYAEGEDDDEAIFKLEQHRFVPGDYVTIKEHDGGAMTFKVTQVRVG